MVKIRRGEHETMVSMASYESIFKPLGYTLIEENKVEIPIKVETSKEVETPKKVSMPKISTAENKRKKKQEEK